MCDPVVQGVGYLCCDRRSDRSIKVPETFSSTSACLLLRWGSSSSRHSAITRIRTWVVSATIRSTNHYTITTEFGGGGVIYIYMYI